jgi:tetratricopeptide (TPR) repeat protein
MNKLAVAPIAALAVIYAATIPLNLTLKDHFVRPAQEEDIIQRMFGGLRALVADWAFMKAEEYHHKGLPFMKAMEYHSGESFTSEVMARGDHEDGEEGHHHGQGSGAKKDLYSRLYSSVKITEDTHLKPAEEKEVLPWFFVEVAFNPHDIRGYTLGGYWLEKMGQKEEALKFLKEGEKKNPDSAMILGSIGWIYFQDGKLQEAAEYLDKASRLWLEGKGPNAITTTYQRSDRYFAIDRLGAVYEKLGRIDDALAIYQILYQIEPAKLLGEKIKRLKNEGQGFRVQGPGEGKDDNNKTERAPGDIKVPGGTE